MAPRLIILTALLLVSLHPAPAQKQNPDNKGKKLPPITVKDFQGKNLNVSSLSNGGKPFALMFWATWCGPCIKELNNTADVYGNWKKKTGLVIYAVNIDDSRAGPKIRPYVQSRRWEYEILLDPNQELMRAMGCVMPPFTVLVDGNGQIVWTHSSYVDGDEYEFEKKLYNLGEK